MIWLDIASQTAQHSVRMEDRSFLPVTRRMKSRWRLFRLGSTHARVWQIKRHKLWLVFWFDIRCKNQIFPNFTKKTNCTDSTKYVFLPLNLPSVVVAFVYVVVVVVVVVVVEILDLVCTHACSTDFSESNLSMRRKRRSLPRNETTNFHRSVAKGHAAIRLGFRCFFLGSFVMRSPKKAPRGGGKSLRFFGTFWNGKPTSRELNMKYTNFIICFK